MKMGSRVEESLYNFSYQKWGVPLAAIQKSRQNMVRNIKSTTTTSLEESKQIFSMSPVRIDNSKKLNINQMLKTID